MGKGFPFPFSGVVVMDSFSEYLGVCFCLASICLRRTAVERSQMSVSVLVIPITDFFAMPSSAHRPWN